MLETRQLQQKQQPWAKLHNTHFYINNKPKAPTSLEDFYTIYTDGSKIENKVGAAFIVLHRDTTKIHTAQYKLQQQNSVFQAEQLAIIEASKWTQSTIPKRCNIYIFTDSASTIHSYRQQPTRNSLSQQFQNIVTHSHHTYHLIWVKGHAGTAGNEAADALARGAALGSEGTPVDIPWPISRARALIKQETLSTWQHHWDNAPEGRKLYKLIPKVKASFDDTYQRSAVLLLTGHGPFPEYLHRFHIKDSPFCICGEIGTAAHYLHDCPSTDKWHLKRPSLPGIPTWLHSLKNRHVTTKLDKIIDICTGQDLALPDLQETDTDIVHSDSEYSRISDGDFAP